MKKIILVIFILTAGFLKAELQIPCSHNADCPAGMHCPEGANDSIEKYDYVCQPGDGFNTNSIKEEELDEEEGYGY